MTEPMRQLDEAQADKRGAARLAREVADLIRRGVVSARSPLGDALLDYAPELCDDKLPLLVRAGWKLPQKGERVHVKRPLHKYTDQIIEYDVVIAEEPPVLVSVVDETGRSLAEWMHHLSPIVPPTQPVASDAPEYDRDPTRCQSIYPENASVRCVLPYWHKGLHRSPVGQSGEIAWETPR